MTPLLKHAHIAAILALLASSLSSFTAEKGEVIDKKTIMEIELLIRRLGNGRFRIREMASRELACVHRGDRVLPHKRDEHHYRIDRYLKQRLRAVKDPEIAARIRDVLADAKPNRRLPPRKLPGMINLPHFVDQKRDTLDEIAEVYGSRKAWILAANPGIRSDKELRMVKEIQVPVKDLKIRK